MNEKDLISTVTIKQVSEGGDSVRADLKASADAQDQLAASAQNLAVVTASAADKQTSVASKYSALQRATDPAARALADLEKAQRTLGLAFDQDPSRIGEINRILDVYESKLSAASKAAENLRSQQAALSATPVRIQDTINQNLGVGGPSSGTSSAKASASAFFSPADIQAQVKATDDQSAALSRLRAQMNPLEVEQGKLGAQSAMYNAALKSGAMTAAEYAAAQAMLGSQLGSAGAMAKSAAAATGEFGLAAGIGSTQAMALFAALRHMFDATAAGIPITRVLAMEIGNLSYGLSGAGGIMSGVGAVFSKIGSFLSPINLLAGGTIALGAAAAYVAVNWSNAQKEVALALTGIGQRTGTTSDDINKFAAANASATGLSVSQARTAAIELTKTGDVSISSLKGVGDAIHGFSVLTGTTAADATKVFAKALGGDAVQAAEEFNKTYGFLDASTRDYIRTLEMQGDRSKAIQVILDAMATGNQKAADSVGILSKAWAGLGNILASIKTPAPPSLPDQITSLKSQRDTVANAPSTLGGNYGQVENFVDPGIAAKTAAIAEIDKQIDALQKKLDEFTTEGVVKKLAAISLAGDDLVRSTIPEIGQLEKLQAALEKLIAAQNTPGVAPGKLIGQNDAAITSVQNQIAKVQEAQGDAERYNQRVQEISQSWGNVSQSTALSLQSLENQLPVVQAVTEAAKMQAQYYATINELKDKGKSADDAQLIAAKQYQTSQAAANASIEKQIASLKDSTAMIKAQQTGTEATTAASIAYKNAIAAGADSTKAASLASATLANYLAKSGDAAHQLEQSMVRVANAADSAQDAINKASQDAQNAAIATAGGQDNLAFGGNNVPAGKGYTSVIDTLGFARQIQTAMAKLSVDDVINKSLASGGLAAAIKAAEQPIATGGTPGTGAFGGIGGQTLNPPDFAKIAALYDLKNAQAPDNSAKVTNLQEEMAWLQKQPETIARDQSIVSLQQSIDQLKNSTDGLNSTNQDLLSPYYTQDPRTSHIGFRSQGMADGGELTVPGGYSANDNMLAQIPVASGEIVSVRRPGQSSGGGNTQSIVIHMPVTIQGSASKDDVGRTLYQAGQSIGRQLAASTR